MSDVWQIARLAGPLGYPSDAEAMGVRPGDVCAKSLGADIGAVA